MRPTFPLRWTPLAIAVTILAGAASLPAHADLLDEIRARQHMVIAHREASIPFSYVDEAKNPMGYALDICQRLTEAVRQHLRMTSLPVKYVQVSSSTRIPTIAERKADLECGSTTNNAERRRLVDYTIAHFIASSRLVVKADSRLNDIQDMRGKRIATTKGSTNLKALRRINKEQFLELEIVEANDHAEGFAMMARGDVVAFAMDDVLLYGLIASSPQPDNYRVVGKVMTMEPYAITMPRNEPAFKKVIDQAMRDLIASREIHRLYSKWFESPIPPQGNNLKLSMSYILRDSFKYPSDRVDDWYKD